MALRSAAIQPESFGDMVRRLREQRGISQGELGRRGGLAPSTISMIESGGRGKQPGRDTVMALATGLETEPGPLLVAAGWEPTGASKGTGVRRAIAHDALLAEDEKQSLLFLYERFTRGRRGRR